MDGNLVREINVYTKYILEKQEISTCAICHDC